MYGDLKDDIRRAIEFRYQLSPYLYSLMERAHRTGLPIMEPMCSAFQNDVKCYEEGVDFMFGDSLLVANVVEKGAATRKVYLPEGETFYDFYTREAYEGGQTIEIPVTISSIPLFVTGGAIIPMASNAIDNLATQKATGLTILCAADRDAQFDLYEDDGVSMDYENGKYLRTKISLTAGEDVYKRQLQTLMTQFEVMPRYWSQNNPPYEVDFLIQRENDIFPIEVKSETNIASKSLKKFKELFPAEVKLRIRFSLDNLKLDGDVLNIPLFLADHTDRLIGMALEERGREPHSFPPGR